MPISRLCDQSDLALPHLHPLQGFWFGEGYLAKARESLPLLGVSDVFAGAILLLSKQSRCLFSGFTTASGVNDIEGG